MNKPTPYSYVTRGGVHNTKVSVTDDDATLEDLCGTFKHPLELDVPSITYHNGTKKDKSNWKKPLPYFVGGVLYPARRDDANVRARTLLTLDIEQGKPDAPQPPKPETVVAALRKLGGQGWVYTSLGHTPNAPRYRVVLPLGKHITHDDHATHDTLKATTLHAAGKLGIADWCTPESWTLSQPMYLPAKLKGGVFYQEYVTGKAWAPVKAKSMERTKAQPADIPDERPDYVLTAVKAAGLYLSENPKHKGMHFITCPFVDQHEAENDTQTVYYEAHYDGNPRPAVKCFDTAPDTDGTYHLTYVKLVRWLTSMGYLAAAAQQEAGVLDDVESFLQQANTANLFVGEIEPTDWVVNEFIPAQEVTVLAAPGGQGKSMLMLHLACFGAFGEPFGGFKFQAPTRTLYISYEDRIKTFKLRLRGIRQALVATGKLDMLYDVEQHLGANVLLHTMGSSDAASWVLSTKQDRWGEPVVTPRVQWLIDVVRAGGVRMLVLDPLVYTHHLDENSNREMAVLMRALGVVAEQANCAVVVVHHMSKDGGWKRLDEVNAAGLRGASSVADNSRSSAVLMGMPREDALTFGVTEDDAKHYALCVHVKHTHNEHGPHPVQVFKRGGSGLVPAPEVQRMSKEHVAEAREHAKEADNLRRTEAWAGRLLQVLADHDGPITTNQIAVALNITVKNRLRQIVEHCEQQDWLEVEDGPNRSRLHVLTKLGRNYLKMFKK